jgi:hypothetical protein
MHDSRRRLLTTFVAAVGALATKPLLLSAFQQHPEPQPMPSPNAPTNQNAPMGLNTPPLPTNRSHPRVDPQNQKQFRMDVQRLYALVSELKDEVDNTNANSVLSVAIVKKAHEIEKLAKEIRNRAKQ